MKILLLSKVIKAAVPGIYTRRGKMAILVSILCRKVALDDRLTTPVGWLKLQPTALIGLQSLCNRAFRWRSRLCCHFVVVVCVLVDCSYNRPSNRSTIAVYRAFRWRSCVVTLLLLYVWVFFYFPVGIWDVFPFPFHWSEDAARSPRRPLNPSLYAVSTHWVFDFMSFRPSHFLSYVISTFGQFTKNHFDLCTFRTNFSHIHRVFHTICPEWPACHPQGDEWQATRPVSRVKWLWRHRQTRRNDTGARLDSFNFPTFRSEKYLFGTYRRKIINIYCPLVTEKSTNPRVELT